MAFYITEKSIRVADAIVNILINEKCTVKEAQGILYEVSQGITATSTVQNKETYKQKFGDVTEPHKTNIASGDNELINLPSSSKVN